MMDIEPDWVHLSEDANGIAMNTYFAEHPEMIVGKMEMVSGPMAWKAPANRMLQDCCRAVNGCGQPD